MTCCGVVDVSRLMSVLLVKICPSSSKSIKHTICMRGSQQCDFTRYTGERKRLLSVFNGAQGVLSDVATGS